MRFQPLCLCVLLCLSSCSGDSDRTNATDVAQPCYPASGECLPPIIDDKWELYGNYDLVYRGTCWGDLIVWDDGSTEGDFDVISCTGRRTCKGGYLLVATADVVSIEQSSEGPAWSALSRITMSACLAAGAELATPAEQTLQVSCAVIDHTCITELPR